MATDHVATTGAQPPAPLGGRQPEQWRKASEAHPRGMHREHWRFLNSLMGRKARTTREPKCTPDAMNEAFLRKVRDIRSPLEREPMPVVQELGRPERLRTFAPVTALQAHGVLSRVKATESAGEDEVPMAVLCALKDAVAGPIANVANAVRHAGWPRAWKRAEITAIWAGSISDVRVKRGLCIHIFQ